MSQQLSTEIARVQERIGSLNDRIVAAHTRIDGLTKEVKDELDEISRDVKTLLANMHEARGGKAAWVLVGSLGVGLLGALAKIFIH
jgi:predicted  nucleic acid-binding Zn-ribbon protein